MFCDKTLSNFYFDWVKNPLYLLNKDSSLRKLHQAGLFEVLMATFDLVKVFVPFVAEEFFQDFFNNNSSVLENFFFDDSKVNWVNSLTVLADWNKVQDARKLTQGNLEPLQKNKTVKSRTEVGVHLNLNNEDFLNFEFVQKYFKLSELLSVSFVHLGHSQEMHVDLVVLNNHSDYAKCPRCWNYELKTHFHDELCNHCHNEN